MMMKWEFVVSLLLNASIIGLAVYAMYLRRNAKVTFAAVCMICGILLVEINDWINEEYAWIWIVDVALMAVAIVVLRQTSRRK